MRTHLAATLQPCWRFSPSTTSSSSRCTQELHVACQLHFCHPAWQLLLKGTVSCDIFFGLRMLHEIWTSHFLQMLHCCCWGRHGRCRLRRLAQPHRCLQAAGWQTRTAAHPQEFRSGLGTDKLERQTVLPLRATWRSWTAVRRAPDQHHSMMSFLMKVRILKQIYRDTIRWDAGDKWIFFPSPRRVVWLLG